MAGGAPRISPDGSVLIGLNRSGAPKTPVLAVFHPATNEITYVPPELLAALLERRGVPLGMGRPGRHLAPSPVERHREPRKSPRALIRAWAFSSPCVGPDTRVGLAEECEEPLLEQSWLQREQ